jgi:hypothetical protein
LLLIQKSGQIADIKIQPSFELQPSYKKNGKTIKSIHYKADFAYYDLIHRCKVVEDVKGMKTQVYKLKKKMFEYKYPELTLTEVA